MQKALEEDPRFAHYSNGESVDSGAWGLNNNQRLSSALPTNGGYTWDDSLSDRVEIAIVSFLQKNPDCIYLEIEDDLYPRFPGLLTPSKAIIYAVLQSYAERNGAAWKLRAEDVASVRRGEVNIISATLESIGNRLGYSTVKQDKNYLWQEDNQTHFVFHIFASALIGRALHETPFPPEQTILVIPGGRAALAAYKAQRDPALAARMKKYRIVKYRLLRTLAEVPVLTRETFEEQVASDPLEKSKAQMMMF